MPYRWAIAGLVLAITAYQAAASHTARSGGEPSRNSLPMVLDATDVANSALPKLDFGAAGAGVVRAEILLSRAHFSCGQIDGHFGSNLEKALAAFQRDRRLPQSGSFDSVTWAVLNQDTAPPLTRYTISPEDEKGPFAALPSSMKEAAKRHYLGYRSPLDELSERCHASPNLLQALNPNADFSRPGQELWVPNVIIMPPGETAARVEVSKSESSVRVYDGAEKLLAFYVATIGSEHDPLPLGEWKIVGKRLNPYFHYNAKLFWDAKDPNAKAVIQPGPRNPVGLVWIDLSKAHYGIHGTPDPGRVGHAFSHGCIRLTNWDALELALMVKPGIPAVLKD